jgi:hypothetical protein
MIFALCALTSLNILFFYDLGYQQATHYYCSKLSQRNRRCRKSLDNGVLSHLSLVASNGLVQYKENRLVNVQYQPWSILMHKRSDTRQCQRIIHEYPSMRRKFSCLAVVPAAISSAYNLLRHEEPIPLKKSKRDVDSVTSEDQPKNSTGFFDNVANDKGRLLLSRKLSKLLNGLETLQQIVLTELANRNLFPGARIVVMVLNAGEMDVFANFACSCRRNNISMRNMLVFSSQQDVVALIKAFGAMAIYHDKTFAAAPRRAAYEYLDPIFIDMMWYKAFSVWLCLHLNFDVLFQVSLFHCQVEPTINNIISKGCGYRMVQRSI